MTSSQIARLLHGRRIGRGKWMAKCCAHPDKTASLSITEMKGGNTRLHCFSGCPQQAVVEAAGLKWGDLTLESVPDPFWVAKRAEEDRLALIEKRVGLALMMGAIEPLHKRYWDAVERNGIAEIERIRPDKQREVRRIIEEYGIPELMECVYPHWEIDDSGPHNLPAKTWDCFRIAGKFRYVIAGDQRSIFAGGSGLHAGERGILIYEEGIGK